MRRVSAWGLVIVALAALLSVPSLTAAPTVAAASPASAAKRTTFSVVTTPGTVTVYENGAVEPTGVLVTVSPARSGRTVTFQRLIGDTWTTERTARTSSAGTAFLPYTATTLGTVRFRAKVAAGAGFAGTGWKETRLTTKSNLGCRADVVDPNPRGELTCLAARLDRWQRSGLMGVGQQVNISTYQDWDRPLRGIHAPALVGFDLQELDEAATAEYPYAAENIRGLLDRAHDGAVLVASWHATNPFNGKPYDSGRQDLSALLRDTAAARRFWADWDAKLELLRRFQEGDADGDGQGDSETFTGTAVVLRPLHEVNGGFFWWGKPSASVYRQVWARLQRAAWDAGVHNVLWAYSGNRRTSSTTDPAAYVPTRVDVGGLDTYDPELGTGNAVDRLNLEGYGAITKKVDRMALTEVGPHGSMDGAWNPAVITRTVRQQRIRPLWAMLWFDDSGYADAGRKQISSLKGGTSWLRSCGVALCSIR